MAVVTLVGRTGGGAAVTEPPGMIMIENELGLGTLWPRKHRGWNAIPSRSGRPLLVESEKPESVGKTMANRVVLTLEIVVGVHSLNLRREKDAA